MVVAIDSMTPTIGGGISSVGIDEMIDNFANDPYGIGLDPAIANVLSAGATDANIFQQPSALNQIFGGLLGAGQSILSSPDALTGIAGGLLTREAYDRLSNIGEQAKREAMSLAERGQRESEFRPFTVTTPTQAMFSARPTEEGLQIGMELSPEERALQQQLLGGAGGFFGQAMTPTQAREQAIFDRIRATQRPDEERQRLALEERLLSQGRLGTSSATYGGGTPEQLALATAQEEARNRAMLTAMQQAQAEQAQQAALGGQLLGASFLPQQQLIEATRPGLIQQELAQQAQQFGTGLFGETALSGIEAQLLQEQARANLLGGIGSNLITGLMNQQRAAASQGGSGGGSGLGGLFGDIVDNLGSVGSGIRRLLNF